jgi:hypothetical protein
MQVTLVQLAAQACVAFEASKNRVNRVFVPTNMLLSVSIYRNTGEVSICPKGNIPLRDNDSSWQQRLFAGAVRPRAHDEFISKAKHCSTRLIHVDNVAWNASTLELLIRVNKK